MDPAAELLVGQPDDAARAHAGVLIERGLHLGRVHVGAAHQDHVVETVGQVEVAVLVQEAHVAERLPAVPALRAGADVAVGDRSVVGALQVDLTDLARREVAAFLVEDPDPAAADRPPDRAAVRQPFRAAQDGDYLLLRAAVELPDAIRAEPLDPGLFEPGRAGRGKVVGDPQAGEVVSGPLLSRQLPDPQHHGRDQVHVVDPVALHQRQRRGRVEARHDDVVAAQEEASHGRAEGAIVVERPGHQVRPAGKHAVDLGTQLGDVDDRRKARDDELRAPGAAARGGRLPLGGHPVWEVGGGELRSRLEPDRDAGAADDLGADDQGRVGEVDDLFQLKAGRAAGDGLRRRAQLPGRQAGFEELDPVW